MEASRTRLPASRWLTARRLRRWSQIFFLTLFVLLAAEPEYRGSVVRLFFEIDPLAALANALATHALYRGLLWSLVILIPTLFLGRFFCGWICPLGTLNHFVSRLHRPGRRIASNRYRGWQRLKYYVLIAVLVAAVFGSGIVGILDPISLAARSLTLSVLPGLNYALNAVIDLAGRSPSHYVRFSGTALHFVLKDLLISFRQPHFRQGFFLGLLFFAILTLNLSVTRFWCRALCPLGALLGLVSRWSILGLEKHPSQCGDCNRCLLDCQGGDDPIPGAQWRQAECHLCLNCVAACPETGIRFRLFPGPSTTVATANLKRRAVVTSLATGAALVPLARVTTGLAAEPSGRLIRPPASLDEKRFLERCIRCGECMKVCPSNALHPSFAEAGFEGLWTPVVVPRVGYCEPSCTLCGEVCPTGAIWTFSPKEKAWLATGGAGEPIRLGTAFYDRGRCLPWAMATECIVCEEWCPTSPKAVYLRSVEVVDAAGNTVTVRQPYIDPARCVGCGACEYACPVVGSPAVYVTSAGESRSAASQMLLRRTTKPTSWFPEDGEAPGWTRMGEIRTFEAADLWKYVDGDAERYVSAGVRRTRTARYQFRGRIEAVADIHLCGAVAGAAKLFDSEPAVGSRPVSIGDAARSYGQSVTFRKGPYFVRLVAYEDGAEAALIGLAQAIAARVGQ